MEAVGTRRRERMWWPRHLHDAAAEARVLLPVGFGRVGLGGRHCGDRGGLHIDRW